jgi:hypothetical protein
MYSFNTTIINKNTCLVRGYSKRNINKNQVWFAYIGNDIENYNKKFFCDAKKFVSQYTEDKIYEYWKVNKPLHLLKIPYIITGYGEEEEMLDSIIIAKNLINYINDNETTSNTVKKYGILELKRNIISLLFDYIDLSMLTDDNAINSYKEVLKIREHIGPKNTSDNPDYSITDLICEMGFTGWLRISSYNSITYGDEIMICNINDILKNNIITKNNDCNLYECNE